MNISKYITMLAASMVISSCGNMSEIRSEIDTQSQEIQSLSESYKKRKDEAAGQVNIWIDKPYVGSKGTINERGDAFPKRFDHVTISTPPGQKLNSLDEITAKISQKIGIPIRIQDSDRIFGTGRQGGSTSRAMRDSAGNVLAPPTLAGLAGLQDVGLPAGEGLGQSLQYSGSLYDLIDQLAAHYRYDWYYKDGIVIFFRYVSKTYEIHQLPTKHEIRSTVKSDSQPGSKGGSSDAGNSYSAAINSDVSASATLDHWADLKNNLETIVGDDGEVTISQSTGSVTVTTTRTILKQVDRYIADLNEEMTRQIVIRVRVASVTISEGQQFGLEMNGVFNSLVDDFSVEMRPVANAFPNASAELSATILNAGGGFNGSELLLQALSQKGEVSLVTSSTVQTQNHVPAPVQAATTNSYLAEVETTITNDGLTSKSLIPGAVTTGFMMTVLPNILDDGRILLEFNGSISELLELTVFGDGENNIQLPQISQIGFSNRSFVASGETLVLSGFERIAKSYNKQTSGPAGIPVLGGGVHGSKEKQTIVVIIEPVIVEAPVTIPSIRRASFAIN